MRCGGASTQCVSLHFQLLTSVGRQAARTAKPASSSGVICRGSNPYLHKASPHFAAFLLICALFFAPAKGRVHTVLPTQLRETS